MCQERLFLDNVDFYQFAAVVEDHILAQNFSTASGNKVSFQSRRNSDETYSFLRLEIGANGNFWQRITLDCREVSRTPRLLVIAKCWDNSLLPAFEKILAEIKLVWITTSSSFSPEPTPVVRLSEWQGTSEQRSASQQFDGWGRPIQVEPTQETEQGTENSEEPTPSVDVAWRTAKVNVILKNKQISQAAACELVGISRKTHKKWRYHEVVREMEKEITPDDIDSILHKP